LVTVQTNKIDIQAELELSDFYIFRLSMFFREVWNQFFLIPTVLALIWIPFHLNDWYSFYFGGSYVIFRVFIPLYILFSPLYIYISSKNTMEKMGTIKTKYCISNYGVSVEGENDNNSKNYPWKEINKIEETKNRFFIFISGNISLIIPKREFTNSEDLSKMKEFFNRNMDKKNLELRK